MVWTVEFLRFPGEAGKRSRVQVADPAVPAPVPATLPSLPTRSAAAAASVRPIGGSCRVATTWCSAAPPPATLRLRLRQYCSEGESGERGEVRQVTQSRPSALAGACRDQPRPLAVRFAVTVTLNIHQIFTITLVYIWGRQIRIGFKYNLYER